MENKNWVGAPTRKQALGFGIIGIIGTVLLIFTMTNFLTENPFQSKNLTFFLLFIITVTTTTAIIRNYVRQAKK